MLVINVGAAPLYREPYGRELIDEAWYGQEAEMLEDLGEFCRVRMEYGYEGYVRRRQLSDRAYGGGRLTVRSPFADVLDSPSYQAGRLFTLPRGAVVEGDGQEGDWQRVKLAGGGAGFMRRTHLREARNFAAPYDAALRRDIVDAALSYMGAPYRWGGRTPAGIDCSGLCHAAYLLNGVRIYRDSRMTEGYPVRPISVEAMAPADLLYFPGHIALYLGQGKYVHATGRAGEDRVRINSLNRTEEDYREDLARGLMHVGSIF